MNIQGLEGTPLGSYAKAQEEKEKGRTNKADGQRISTQKTEKGTKISGLHRDEGHDPHADIGYMRK